MSTYICNVCDTEFEFDEAENPTEDIICPNEECLSDSVELKGEIDDDVPDEDSPETQEADE